MTPRSTEGTWTSLQTDHQFKAEFKNAKGCLEGFVLLGKATSEKQVCMESLQEQSQPEQKKYA